MRPSSKKLSLARQTLRTLTADELLRNNVRGGIVKDSNLNGVCGNEGNSQKKDPTGINLPPEAYEDIKNHNTPLVGEVVNP